MSSLGSHDSSPSKDSESSSSIHRPSPSHCKDDIIYPSIPTSPILSTLATEHESNFVLKENPPEQIAESSSNINPPIYTRRLIPMKYIPVDEIDENFDEQ